MQIGTVLQIPSSKKTISPTPLREPVESAPPTRKTEDLPPIPEPPAYKPEIAPEPEIPPISVEEGPPPPALAKKPEEQPTSPSPDFDLITPEPETESTDLVVIDENSRLTDIASRYLTDVATLNKLNNVELAPDQMIKSGSQLYIPRH